MYITEDIGDIYVDISSTERIRLNAESAEKLRKITYNADGSKKSEISVDYDYILGLAAQISDLNSNITNKSVVTVNTWEDATSPSTSEIKTSFIINKVKDDTTYEAMEANDLIDPDQIYLVEGPDNKMDKENPVGTGSFSMNRKANSTIGDHSYAEGYQTTASGTVSHAEGLQTIASGINSHAEGDITTASGDDSHAEGNNTTAEGLISHAEGSGTIASGMISHAEGWTTIASGTASHAEGYTTTASGDNSHAEGKRTIALAEYSHTEGIDNIACSAGSHAEGRKIVAYGVASHAEGSGIKDSINLTGEANSVEYIVEGVSVDRLKVGSVIYYEGAFARITSLNVNNNMITLDDTLCVDNALNSNPVDLFSYGAFGAQSHAEGDSTTASGNNAHAEGFKTTASNTSAHAEGVGTIADNIAAHAEGYETKASGWSSHAEGEKSIVTSDNNITATTTNYANPGFYGHAEGYGTVSYGAASHAEGSGTMASGMASHAEGEGTMASGNYSHAEGLETIASGHFSHAEGVLTLADRYSHAEGYVTKAIGIESHAEGWYTIAAGHESHAEGDETLALGMSSHAEGYGAPHHIYVTGLANSTTYTVEEGSDSYEIGNYIAYNAAYAKILDFNPTANTITLDATLNPKEDFDDVQVTVYINGAFGSQSHTEGVGTTASGGSSHAEGDYTIASGSRQHVQGKYNIEDTTSAHIVGNGTTLNSRSNAHTLDWDGNAWFAGDVYVDSTSGTNKDEGSKKLATEEYVTNILSNAGGAFYAAYGTTTNAQIKAAYDAGKTVLCAYDTRIYRLYTIPTGVDAIYFTSEYDHDGENDRLRYLYVSTSNEWSSSYSTDSSFSSAKSYNGSTEIVSTKGYYRPIRVSTAEPTAADGNVGDIWIQYSV